MRDLRETFEAGGLEAVRTYIQSGNVLFASTAPRVSLEAQLEELLKQSFGVPITVVLRTHRQLRDVIDKAPGGFGMAPDTYHSDVLFLKAPLTKEQALGVIELREGVDQVWPGPGVLYFSRVSDRRSQSRMSRITSTPEYRLMTIRTWTTTTKLLHLLDES
jgi:uncharacterized protein (DUF1697 family)